MSHYLVSKSAVYFSLALLFLSACSASAPITTTPSALQPTVAPTPPPSPTAVPVQADAGEAFPTGVMLDCPECGSNFAPYTEIYFDDGTLIVYKYGKEELRGRWYVESNVLYTGDTWCHDQETVPASYTWQFDGEFLIMELIDDQCGERVGSLDGKAWRVVETAVTP